MPCLKIFTNLDAAFVLENLVQKLLPILATVLHEPENNFVVIVSDGCTINFHGQSAASPGAIATLETLESLGLEQNEIITKEFTNFIQKELGIASENFLLTYQSFQSDMRRIRGIHI